MINTQKKTPIIEMVLVGMFAAITFIGVQYLRIAPSPPPAPFFHFGNVFLMLGAIILGAKNGSISATIAYVLFDLLNGYISSIPKIILTSIIKCLIVVVLFNIFKKFLNIYLSIIISTISSFAVGIIIEYIYNVIEAVILGSTLNAAIIAQIQSSIPSIINALIATAIVPLIYPIIIKALSIIKIHVY